MLYITNTDKPGFIGALGSVLGDAGLNIGTFHLGRKDAGGEAIALLALDGTPSDEVLGKIKALPNVKQVKSLRF